MYGYVVINQPELKFKEFDLYRSYYCGFCQNLKHRYGRISQLTLSYDFTFLIMLLSDLYDAKDVQDKARCIAHPFEKHPTRQNQFTDYASDMNLILSYYSCIDDWEDEKKITRLLLSKGLYRGKEKAKVSYGKKAAVVKDRLDKLHELEAAGESSIDKVAGLFGDIMAEVFAPFEDEWESDLRKMGFFLGKFIYIMDAFDDMEKDRKKGNYNPILIALDQGTIKEDEVNATVKKLLTMMMAPCCEAFETLPCVEYTPILRNILYSGVFGRYNAICSRREKENGGGGTREAASDGGNHG